MIKLKSKVTIGNTLEILRKYKQEHLLTFINELTDVEKNNYLNQLTLIDFEEITRNLNNDLNKNINYDAVTPINADIWSKTPIMRKVRN